MNPYLKSIKISNLGGIEKLNAELHAATVIVGDNHTGKSSLLDSVSTIFQGGSDSDLLHAGAAKGRVEIEFGNGYKAIKEINPTGYDLKVFDPAGGSIAKAATKVKEWVPKDSFDIRELIRMVLHDSKELEKFLLDHLPLRFTTNEINAAMGVVNTVASPMTLPELNAQRKALYDQRTNANRDKKNLEGTIATLEGQLPEKTTEDWGAKRDRLTKELATIQAKKNQAESTSKSILADALREKRAEIDAQIRKLEEQYATYEKGAREKAATFLAQETEEISQEFAKVSVDLATARAAADQQTRAAGVVEAVAKERARLKGYVTLESNLTGAIDNLDSLKARKLKELPVDGLDIKQNGKETIITVNDVPLHKLSGQEQIFMVVRFMAEAQKAAGQEMRILVCEGAELSEGYLQELAQACVEAGIQLIVSMRVRDAELHVLSLQEFADQYLVNGSAA